MICVTSKKCMHEKCSKQPAFNLPTETKGIYCLEHKKENMISVTVKKCTHKGCSKRPSFNLPTETNGIYCFEHKKENMVDVKNKKCIYEECNKQPNFNLPTEKNGIYCMEHKKENMINIKSKKCQFKSCKNDAVYGLLTKKVQYCYKHKTHNMVNIILEKQCDIPECDNEYEFTINDLKYCLAHCPDKNYEIILKRKCKYCDIEENSKFICKECLKVQNKKEWMTVRHIRKNIDTKFEYNTSKMLQGCSQKRPDIYFELNKHCVIVEIDENQHKTYGDVCECARINEIVNGIGGKSVIIIRFNPDIIKNNKKEIKINWDIRLAKLIETIKSELSNDHETFKVEIIQLYYDDNFKQYIDVKKENITNLVCI